MVNTDKKKEIPRYYPETLNELVETMIATKKAQIDEITKEIDYGKTNKDYKDLYSNYEIMTKCGIVYYNGSPVKVNISKFKDKEKHACRELGFNTQLLLRTKPEYYIRKITEETYVTNIYNNLRRTCIIKGENKNKRGIISFNYLDEQEHQLEYLTMHDIYGNKHKSIENLLCRKSDEDQFFNKKEGGLEFLELAMEVFFQACRDYANDLCEGSVYKPYEDSIGYNGWIECFDQQRNEANGHTSSENIRIQV